MEVIGQRIIPMNGLGQFVRTQRLKYTGTNSKGEPVYKNQAGLLYVVSHAGEGRLLIKVMKSGCNC